MRTSRIVAAVALGACVSASATGCQHKSTHPADAGDSPQKQDTRAQSEGRLEVDQSAVLPVDVRAGVMREYPGATVQSVTKKTDQGQGGRPGVRYQVDLTTKDGKKVSREFDDKGKASAS